MSHNFIKLIDIKILKKGTKETIHSKMPKNAKNHAISLLQMQRCPQSNAKQEINYYFFKDTLKEISIFFKRKETQTKPQSKVQTLGKNLYKID